jgi:pimeloyl-ACP methyl ester carboxylesterase
MATARNGEVELYCERLGEGGDGPVLLVNGLGDQVGGFGFPDALCETFVGAGLEVIRFDNRDAGLSTELAEAGPVDIATVLAGGEVPIPYTVHDMANDAIAVLDEFGVQRAHLLGMSMGGFISRWAAIDHPDRVASLTLHVTGAAAPADGDGPELDPNVVGAFVEQVQPREREQAIEESVSFFSWLWGEGGGAPPEEEVRQVVEWAFDRAYRPLGTQRQLLSTFVTPGLMAAQRGISCPTLVTQGAADPVFPREHGEAIAGAIPGAELWVVPGMGHSTPPEIWEELTQRIAAQVRTPAAA